MTVPAAPLDDASAPSRARSRPTAASPKRGRRPRQFEQLDVISAAATLFDRQGYDQTKMQDIATRLGISKPTIYNFFAGKTEILEEIFEHIIRGADAILDNAEKIADGSEALDEFVRGSLAFGAGNRSLMNVFMSDERSLPISVRQRHNRWSRRAYYRLRRLVERTQQSPPVVDSRIVTFAITAFVNQMGSWFSQKGDLSLDDVAAGFSTMLQTGSQSARTSAR